MIALGYIATTIIGIFFVGAFAPLVGLVVGSIIHIIVLLYRVTKKLDSLSEKLEIMEKEKS